MKDLNSKIIEYWTERSDTYNNTTIEELYGEDSLKWENLIYENIERNKTLKILDIGTGPGMFAVLMGKNTNYDVYAVDSSKGMLEKATINAQKFNVKVNFQLADAHLLPFKDSTFDVIISRNVTWNLPNPKQAYSEWKRVLKPNGKILNFDSNWYLRLYNEELQKTYETNPEWKLKETLPNRMEKRMEKIAKKLPLSKVQRPNWDINCLLELGFTKINVNVNINRLIYNEEYKIVYEHIPMFMLVITK